MIRMVEMSVRLGISSQRSGIGHKKRARRQRVPRANSVREALARWGSLDQIPWPCNPKKGPSTAIFQVFWLAREPDRAGAIQAFLLQSVFAFALLKLRRTRFALSAPRGCATRSPSGRSVEARPGVEPGKRTLHRPRVGHSATGPIR